ncbi:diguanylate cyclase [Sphingopyxis granuli]|uniref:diguanylate cyclase n=1 Tax=Sphingopyxis granuli TaxID=267128 RepID=UPI0012E7B2DB|nr:diguanylate cyclase [Sphingopyxis granuli]
MQRFILRENLKKFRVRLDAGVADAERAYLLRQIRSIQRELALLNAAALGVQRYPIEFGSLSSRDRSLFHRLTETAVEPTMIIDPRAGMRILDVNDAHTAITYTERHKVAGERLFDVFPDNPDLEDATGVAGLFDSIRIAAQARRQHVMKAQRYDLQGPDSRFLERYWHTVSVPILNDEAQLVCILHQARDVTETVGAAGFTGH